MTSTSSQPAVETWVSATWEEYLQVLDTLEQTDIKSYYHQGKMRLEMAPLGSDHACDHAVIIIAVGLYAVLKNIPLTSRDNCTYRKPGFDDAQPDVSYYVGDNADVIPWGTRIVRLNDYPPPALVIEVADTSLEDDKGEKRLLYEDLGVQEYWIINVREGELMGFEIANQGSRRIRDSQVLPGLSLDLLQEALQRTRHVNQTQVIRWLMEQFQ